MHPRHRRADQALGCGRRNGECLWVEKINLMPSSRHAHAESAAAEIGQVVRNALSPGNPTAGHDASISRSFNHALLS